MNRVLLGVLVGLLLVAAGLFWWQGRADMAVGVPPPASPAGLPSANASGTIGVAPPEATEVTREMRRFDRFDRDRDNRITRNELLAPRADAFRKLDVNHDNLLTFEEWAVRTSDKFKGADANADGWLSRTEYATTKPKPKIKPVCRCAPPAKAASGRKGAQTPPLTEPPDDSGDGEDAGEPGV